MRQLWLDLVYAARLLRKNPGFAAVAILSLAIGIGANSAMFSFADALILRPIPVPHPGNLVVVDSVSKAVRYGDISYRDYVDFRDSAKTVSGLAAFQIAPFGFSTGRDQLPQLTYGMVVSGNFFQVLGVPPVLGRDFTAREDSPAGLGDPPVIVSHSFWKQQLSGDPAALGRRVRLNGTEFTIAGVAPESFTGMDPYLQPALFIPIHAAPLVMATAPANMLEDRANRWLAVRGRLAPGVSDAAAQAEFSTLAARLAHAYPDTNRNHGAWVAQELRSRFHRESLDGVLAIMLVGIAGLVLVIACANLANLMLARGVARSREIAIRLSIGAGRGRLIRQFMTESLLISMLGGIAGLFVAYWLIRALALIKLPTDMPIVLAIRMDERVLLFSLAATFLTGLLFGLVPAIRSSKADLVQALKGATAEVSAGRRRFSLRDVLVVA